MIMHNILFVVCLVCKIFVYKKTSKKLLDKCSRITSIMFSSEIEDNGSLLVEGAENLNIQLNVSHNSKHNMRVNGYQNCSLNRPVKSH